MASTLKRLKQKEPLDQSVRIVGSCLEGREEKGGVERKEGRGEERRRRKGRHTHTRRHPIEPGTTRIPRCFFPTLAFYLHYYKVHLCFLGMHWELETDTWLTPTLNPTSSPQCVGAPRLPDFSQAAHTCTIS